jgi:adenylate cyclase
MPTLKKVKAAVNLAGKEYIRQITDSPDRNKQALIEIDEQPVYRTTAVPPGLLPLWENIRKTLNIRQDAEKTRRYLAYTRLNTAGSVVITTIEYDKVFEGINATTRHNLYLTAAVLALSIMCIWFFAKSISVPLKALAAASRSIEGGVFDIKLKPAGNDEIGLLMSSFGKMCAALGIFGKFTNRDIAVQAMRGQIKPGGLPKHATIFFSDIRGFTEKSENFVKAFGKEASDRIVFWLNEYLTSMVECVEKTSGTVDKFIGDAVMAHWGTANTAGSPQEDAFNCVKTALMMRTALYKLNRNRKRENLGNPPISIGCGINTGTVTAGQIGSDLRMEYTVIGDPVNLASRVESLNKPLGTDILITEDTWKLIKNYFIVEEMPSVTVKGKENPVRLFAVVNHASVTRGPKTLAEVRRLLGITPPDISKADVNAEENKYRIGGK